MSMGPIATTLMACEPDIMDQELMFHQTLSDATDDGRGRRIPDPRHRRRAGADLRTGRGVDPSGYLGRVIASERTQKDRRPHDEWTREQTRCARSEPPTSPIAARRSPASTARPTSWPVPCPGELVEGEVTRDKKSWARVELTRVIEASPQRVEPPCGHFAECGGCQWQYADYPAQLAWKHSIVVGQLQHLGRIEDPPVRETVPTADPYGYRNRMDFAVSEGKPSLRRRRSRDKIASPNAC